MQVFLLCEIVVSTFNIKLVYFHMKYLFITIITSFLFSSYYAIGDTVIAGHQNQAFDVCYGEYPNNELELSHFNGKISIFGLSTSW